MGEMTTRSKADAIRAHRERCVALLRQGAMTVDDYLTQVCGITGTPSPQLRAAVMAQISA
ncbi:hypothetical protein [Azospirillum picis]|uniref:Antitoxin VbhA domain-containing protein n=1 Tax=Azospirillum picis TaxID=488438 RepID=A0ABU0MUX4_9PROT|nr:hypothetical protein [Azospirillum picis]MBP2303448.1 hypothetical protein [Azospirillum picis]MDQ0537293.1 hypothetical protein [Azospirillum picis]